MTLSLAMLKMKKNFIAVISKGYPREPYTDYPIFGDDHLNLSSFVDREMDELTESLANLSFMMDQGIHPRREPIGAVMSEIADVSNTLDFLYERLLQEYQGAT